MDLGSALNSIMEYDIKKHCHINTNEDGDRFVGIKADSDNAMVYFPIGYELPETDAEIRTDIKHLIQVLSEFTTKDDRLLAINKFAAPQTVDFPINAYKSVIEYYFSIGGTYYVEKEQVYITAPTGKQDWARTARKQMPLVQSRNGVSSFVFTQFEVRSSTPNDTTLIWFGLTWSLELYQQTNARLWRQGQKSTVVIHHIISKDTIDEDVMKALRLKEKTQSSLIDAVKARIGGGAYDG